MSESRMWFMLDVLWLLAVAGACFGYLGWWWRGKLAVTMSLPEDLQEISELKERLLEYEIESKSDEMARRVPVQNGPSKLEGSLQRQIAELTAALAAAQATAQPPGQDETVSLIQAELATAREVLAAAEQRQAELTEELMSVKKALALQAPDPQGVLSLEIPEPTEADPGKKKRSGKKK